jgi:hypothetical protein
VATKDVLSIVSRSGIKRAVSYLLRYGQLAIFPIRLEYFTTPAIVTEFAWALEIL